MISCSKVHDILSGKDSLSGASVLVDRLWPRGISKDDLTPDHWFKDVSPTPELRKWFDHDPERFEEFSQRYTAELDSNDSEELAKLLDAANAGDVTLLYAAKDREINHAVVLKRWLEDQTQ